MPMLATRRVTTKTKVMIAGLVDVILVLLGVMAVC